MKAVKPIELDGDWFIIPNEMYEEFIEDSNNEDMCESGGFDDKWYEYKTGGDLNLVQLYTSPMITKLKEHLDNITPEQFNKEIDDIQQELDNKCPTMEDCPHCAYEQQQEYEAELEKDACIDFAKWLAQSDWMSIWVKDKWMWECQLDNSILGYKTEEELYQIYLNEN